MSTSYDSRAVIGVRLNAIYHPEARAEPKTKYNEKNGQPCLITVNKLYATFGNITLPTLEYKKRDEYSRERVWLNWDFLEAVGLKMHCHYCEDDVEYLLNHGIVGIQVCDDDSVVTLDMVLTTFEKVRIALATFGYTGEVLLFSQLDWS